MLRKRYVTWLWMLIFVFASGCNEKEIKVACVGDSITYGYNIKNRDSNNYPVQLQRILGDKFEVKNFGVCGATMRKDGDLSYWNTPEFDSALKFNPDIIVLMLGTNDSKPQNWGGKQKELYKKDYLDMIKKFKSLKSKPKIFICYPPPAFSLRWGINDTIITNEVIPDINFVAKKENLNIIDLYTPFVKMGEHFEDDIHPDSTGAAIIAKTVAKKILK